jgi:hypothetical protein
MFAAVCTGTKRAQQAFYHKGDEGILALPPQRSVQLLNRLVRRVFEGIFQFRKSYAI